MKQIVTTKKPAIPAGYRREKFCTGGYQPSVIGREVESPTPVWAERRGTHGEVWYRLYTYTK